MCYKADRKYFAFKRTRNSNCNLKVICFQRGPQLRLPDVLERQELSLNLLSKLVLSWILEKYLVVFENLPASLKILE